MLPGEMLNGQISLWQLASVKDGSRNLSLKFGQNQVSNSWDIADIEFVVLLLQMGGRVGGVSEFENKAISASIEVEVELSWVEAELGNIPDMDKCCQDKCCLEKCHRDIWHLLKMVPESWLKFGQKWVGSSWDIADMDKCCQDKCCMDKCSFDNCLRLSRVNG